jgi:methyl-accepting chemotaxis protein
MTNSLETINLLTQVRSDQNRLRALILEMIIVEDREHQASMQNQVEERHREVEGRIDSILENLTHYPQLQGDVKILFDSMLVVNRNREFNMELVKAGKIKEAIEFVTTIQEKRYNSVRLGLLEVEKQLTLSNLSEKAVVERKIQRTITILIISGVIIFLIALWFVIGILKLLKRISTEINNGVNVLGTSAAEILTTVTEVSTGATETATAVSETSTTIEEIRQTALLATQRAQAVLEISNRAAAIGETGKLSVSQTIEGMKKINNQMTLITESVVRLSDQNRSIGEITSTVNDVADQTNLLAVNASIEAAKAGEHGRGFAVVAQEIRSLAEQSKQATAQVKIILNEIQKAINQAVIATEQGTKAVENGNQLAVQSGETIEQLADGVDEAVQSVIQISNSSQQQMAGMDQIVPAMENIKQASDQNATGMRQTQMAAQSLNDLGISLKKILEKYNI